MRQLIIIVLLCFLMLGPGAYVGCDDGFDWKAAAKSVALNWVKDKVLVSGDKHGWNGSLKDDAIAWCLEGIDKAAENSSTLKEGLEIIDIEKALAKAWDLYLEPGLLYEAGKNAGMDVDAEFPGAYSWNVTGADFPGMDAELMELF
jgi:hypothetical protein